MKNEKELLEKFKLEELEQRFEMGWTLKKGGVKFGESSSWDGIEKNN